MPTLRRMFKTGVVCATTVLAATLLLSTAQPSHAGLFSWLKGDNNQNAPGGRSYGAPGWGNSQPGSGTHQAPPEEGNPQTRAWITNPAPGIPTLTTRNIEATKAAIERYRAIVAQGGWPMVPASVMKPGSRGQEIVTLHRRLEISGDLTGQSIPDEYDQAVVMAVKKFQARHNLPPTGVIDSRSTIDALNVPATVRLAQLQASLKRLQTLAPGVANRYVLVNVPSAQVEAVEGGQVISRHAAVVGKIERPTPALSSKVSEINFNPYWHVPRSIIQKDLVPKGQEFANRGQDMLAAYRMQVFTPSGQPVDPRSIDWFGPEVYTYNFRQLPWEENSLGFVKINFPNKDAVYMHDTPLKSLFGRSVRFESSGCVRIHNVEQLVAWILGDNPGWDQQRIMSMKSSGQQADVKVAKSIAVYFTYISAWSTPDGVVHFRPDIYNTDTPGETTASAY
ncbi:MAG: L,D-transpeptidase family protein [Methyloceanibacter sp.]